MDITKATSNSLQIYEGICVSRGCGFLRTVGSFLLRLVLFYLQLPILAFLLTIGAFLLTVLAFLLTIGVLFAYSGKCV